MLATLVLCNLVLFSWFKSHSSLIDIKQTAQQHKKNGIPSLTLLNSATALDLNAKAFGAPGKTALSEQRCWNIGPVVEQSLIQRVLSEINTSEVSISSRETGVMAQPGFWVYISPLDTVELITAKRIELRDQGVESYVFRDGRLKNGISLGYFNSAENAWALQKKLKSKGIKGQVGVSENIAESFWLTLSSEAMESLSKEFWLDMAKLNPSLELKSVDCDTD